MTLRILVVGVGGQGVLTLARILGEAALHAGLDVVLGQLHGMAQRGGSVESAVIIGTGVQSSFVEQADVVLGLEPLETLRALPRIGPHTHVLVNLGRQVPFTLSMQGLRYPDVDSMLQQIDQVTPHVTRIDGPALLEQLGQQRSLNLVLLGALARTRGLLPFDEPALRATLTRMSPATRLEANLRAYDLGREG